MKKAHCLEAVFYTHFNTKFVIAKLHCACDYCCKLLHFNTKFVIAKLFVFKEYGAEIKYFNTKFVIAKLTSISCI